MIKEGKWMNTEKEKCMNNGKKIIMNEKQKNERIKRETRKWKKSLREKKESITLSLLKEIKNKWKQKRTEKIMK